MVIHVIASFFFVVPITNIVKKKGLMSFPFHQSPVFSIFSCILISDHHISDSLTLCPNCQRRSDVPVLEREQMHASYTLKQRDIQCTIHLGMLWREQRKLLAIWVIAGRGNAAQAWVFTFSYFLFVRSHFSSF